jgi:hypothetical protein
MLMLLLLPVKKVLGTVGTVGTVKATHAVLVCPGKPGWRPVAIDHLVSGWL